MRRVAGGAHIRGDETTGGAERLRRARSLGGVDVRDHDAGAVRNETPRNGEADAACGPGDDRNLVVERWHDRILGSRHGLEKTGAFAYIGGTLAGFACGPREASPSHG
jgi:hypothetical protein